MMKTSTMIYADLQMVLARIRGLNAEAEACQPIRKPWRLSTAEENENYRRANRLDQIIAELARTHVGEIGLRKSYADTMAAEQAPPPAGPSESLAALHARRDNIKRRLGDLVQERSKRALAGMEGNHKAKAALEKAVADHAAGEIELQNVELAIKQAEQRDAEERREFTWRDAEAKFVAAQSAAVEVTAHDRETDTMMRALAEHLAKRPALLSAVRKTGCEIDDPRLNTLSTVEVLHRAAKAAGLADILRISIRDAVPLEEASRILLKLAIRRPTVAQLATTKAA
jgi:hypothetical protein